MSDSTGLDHAPRGTASTGDSKGAEVLATGPHSSFCLFTDVQLQGDGFLESQLHMWMLPVAPDKGERDEASQGISSARDTECTGGVEGPTVGATVHSHPLLFLGKRGFNCSLLFSSKEWVCGWERASLPTSLRRPRAAGVTCIPRGQQGRCAQVPGLFPLWGPQQQIMFPGLLPTSCQRTDEQQKRPCNAETGGHGKRRLLW